jgi:HK97 family phage prohead protease
MTKHTFLVSDESDNSHGFRIVTEGINTARFENNPVMLYMHETPNLIGRWENLTKKDGKLYADAVFDEEDIFSKEILGKVERGFLKGTSLGITFKKEEMLTDENGDYLKSCELMEISIVPIGSNGNALKLYSDSYETMQLKLNELTASNSIFPILGLKGNPTHEAIVTAVKQLKLKVDKLQLQSEFENKEKAIEAESIVNLLVSRKLLPEHLKKAQLEAFKSDFYTAKKDILNLFPYKSQSLVEIIETERLTGIKTLGKSKAEWNLEDYRKFAPDELQKNPSLYQKLMDDQFKK